MKRRDFLKTGALAAAATPIAMPAIAQAMPEVKWRLTSSFPKSLDTIYGTAQQFAKLMSRRDRRQVPGPDLLGRRDRSRPAGARRRHLRHGRMRAYADLFLHRQGCRRSGSAPASPSASTPASSTAGGSSAAAQEIVNEALAKFDAYSIPCGNSGCQMGGFFRKEIKTVDDLKGLKFRIGGMGGAVLAKLGVVPTQIARRRRLSGAGARHDRRGRVRRPL